MCSRYIRDLRRSMAALAENFGVAVHIETTRGNHLRAIFRSDVVCVSIVMANSPSDWRAQRNAEALARRKLRAAHQCHREDGFVS